MEDLESVFRYLRPLCVLVTQNHDVKSINSLKEVLARSLISNDHLQELQEYVAFPLRLLLKQYALRDENLGIECLNCLSTLLSKTSVLKKEICVDLFNTILNIISPSSKATDQYVSEELMQSAVEAVGTLVKTSSFSCTYALFEEALPLVGALISSLLVSAEKEKCLNLQMSALNCLAVLIDGRQDKELKHILEKTTPSFLPGVSITLTKILSNPKQNSRVLQVALKCMHTIIVSALMNNSDVNNRINNSDSSNSSKDSQNQQLVVVKSEEWYEKTTQKLELVIEKVSISCTNHESWIVRHELVDWAYNLLYHCHSQLVKSKGLLVDVLVSHVADDYTQVASRCQKFLNVCLEKVGGIKEILEERIYEISTKLPRLLNNSDEKQILSSLKLFNGYLKSLSQEVAILLRSHAHVHRIFQAFLHILELDSSGVHILESSHSSAQSIEIPNSTFPLFRRIFKGFSDEKVWMEIRGSIINLTKHGELYGLVEHVISILQSITDHRPQCIIILNEIILYCVNNLKQPLSQESAETFRMLLQVYTSTYNDVLHACPDESLREKSQRTQLQCLLLEGVVYIHQLTGSDYPELLLLTLYSLLESCAHENVLVSQTAINGLAVISKAFNYSGTSELIEKHCNYLSNIISINIRRLNRHRTCPLVLQSVIKHSQKTVLPYIEHIIIEAMICLDENYIENALLLLRVPQVLLRKMCVWFNHSTSSLNVSHARDADLTSNEMPININLQYNQTDPSVDHKSTDAETEYKKLHDEDALITNIVDFVMDYYKSKNIVEGFSINDELPEAEKSDDPEEEDIAETATQEEDTDNKKILPLHLTLTKKILDRIKHLQSHSSARVRLIALETITDGCRILAEIQNELLPMVHDVWSGLVKRFLDSEPLVVIKAIDCLMELSSLAKDFIRARVSKDVLPSMALVLQKQASTSKQTGMAYRHTLEYKLQYKALANIGSICIDLKVGYPVIEGVINTLLLYLSKKQPEKLQLEAVKSLIFISEEDSDIVWYIVSEFGKSIDRLEEYKENIDVILKKIIQDNRYMCK